jgi:hypothetical protein
MKKGTSWSTVPTQFGRGDGSTLKESKENQRPIHAMRASSSAPDLAGLDTRLAD